MDTACRLSLRKPTEPNEPTCSYRDCRDRRQRRVYTSTSPGPQHASRTLEAKRQRGNTPAARRHTSSSLYVQHASRASELLRQTPPRRYLCSTLPELHTSIPPL